MPKAYLIYIFCALSVSLFAGFKYFQLRYRHIPKLNLSLTQKAALKDYGFLHFTSIECAKSIIADNSLNPAPLKSMYLPEKNMIWGYPINKPLTTDYIKEYSHCLTGERQYYEVCFNFIWHI